jgi:hypothetical protein
MIWRFSDGTVATLGGNIEGASAFAEQLRAMLRRDRVGVAFGRMPCGGAWLDVNDAALFDAWLQQEMDRPVRQALELRMVERPDNIPPLPEDDSTPPPEGAIA